jgi:hypothetical protein
VVPEDRGARHTLNALIHRTRFGDTGIRDFMAAADRRA